MRWNGVAIASLLLVGCGSPTVTGAGDAIGTSSIQTATGISVQWQDVSPARAREAILGWSRQEFAHNDANGDGLISPDEWARGGSPNSFASYDSDQDGTIDFAELSGAYLAYFDQDLQDWNRFLPTAFKMLDKKHTGFLTSGQVATIRIAPAYFVDYPDPRLEQRLFSQADFDGNRLLDFGEFQEYYMLLIGNGYSATIPGLTGQMSVRR